MQNPWEEYPETKKPENNQEFAPEQIKLIEKLDCSPNEKVELILVKAGLKLATDIELFSDTWRVKEGESPKAVDEVRLQKIRESIEKAGFAIEIGEPGEDKIIRIEKDIPKEEIKPEDEIEERREKITISVADTKEKLKKYIEAVKKGDDQELGIIYGFPESAIKAYEKEQRGEGSFLVSRSGLPADIKNQEESLFLTFMIAKDNMEEAMQVAKKWARKVKETSPEIYRQYIEYMRKVKNF